MNCICVYCGLSFYRRPSIASVIKFCSNSCQLASRGTLEQRLWKKTNKDGPIPPHKPDLGPCWEWQGSRDSEGYGVLRGPGNGKKQFTHRISWELANGPIPKGLGVLHKCDNPYCLNPSHLFLGTQRDNNRDMVVKGRHTRGETHPRAKLTWVQVDKIREKYMSGEVSRISLAREYGVSVLTVSDILRGTTWNVCPLNRS